MSTLEIIGAIVLAIVMIVIAIGMILTSADEKQKLESLENANVNADLRLASLERSLANAEKMIDKLDKEVFKLKSTVEFIPLNQLQPYINNKKSQEVRPTPTPDITAEDIEKMAEQLKRTPVGFRSVFEAGEDHMPFTRTTPPTDDTNSKQENQ